MIGRGDGGGAGVAPGGPHYVQWGAVSITVPNLIVLCLMIVTFAAALALRLPEERPPRRTERRRDG